MKKSIIASLAVLASAAVVATFALGGAGKLGDVQVNANPTEYSVTFDWGDSTTAEQPSGSPNYVICTTTAAGSKVGVVGFNAGIECFYFHTKIFTELHLADFTSTLVNAGAYEFSHITGFAISFSGGTVKFDGGDTKIDSVTSEKEYKGLSIAPTGYPRFARGELEGIVYVDSLTIWYSC